MDTPNESDPLDELFNEMSKDNLKKISEMIKGISVPNRINYVRMVNPSNQTLIDLYKSASEEQDFEVCLVAKTLLAERGITKFPV